MEADGWGKDGAEMNNSLTPRDVTDPPLTLRIVQTVLIEMAATMDRGNIDGARWMLRGLLIHLDYDLDTRGEANSPPSNPSGGT